MDIEQYQEVLFPLAYQMMGTVADAEDLVQDVMADWTINKEQTQITQVRAYLKKAIINKAINRKKLLKKRLEKYPGKWLPEPLSMESIHKVQQSLDQEKQLRYAVLVLLEKLSPKERAVFLLKEVFDHSHLEIAAMLEIKEENSRQLLRRAKHKLQPFPHKDHFSEEQRQQVEKLMMAIDQVDIQFIQQSFRQDIVAIADGGAKVSAAKQIIQGSQLVARYLAGLRKKFHPYAQLNMVIVNQQWAIIFTRNGKIVSCYILVFEGEYIAAIYVVSNPDKLHFKKQSVAVTELAENGLRL